MADFLFHPEAHEEYELALAWYRKRSDKAARGFEVAVEQVLGLIRGNPEMFPKYDDEHRIALLQRYPYSLIYLEYQGQFFIIAVAHSSRQPGYWRGRAVDGS